MTHRTRHVMSPPIEEAEEIVYDPVLKGRRSVRLIVDLDGDEIDRLKAGLPLDDRRVIRFIKQAALEKADREAQRRATGSDGGAVEAAD